MSGDQEEQRRIARLALEAAGDEAGFALAGSGAIREHGLIDRPTEDVDLFTVQQAETRFGTSLDRIIAALRAVGYTVETRRRQDTFAQLTIVSAQGHSTGMDLGVDWRAHPPVRLEVGPVLARVYGPTASQLDDVKTRTKAWTASIRGRARRESIRSGLHERIEREVERRRAESRGDDEPHRGGPVGRGSR